MCIQPFNVSHLKYLRTPTIFLGFISLIMVTLEVVPQVLSSLLDRQTLCCISYKDYETYYEIIATQCQNSGSS